MPKNGKEEQEVKEQKIEMQSKNNCTRKSQMDFIINISFKILLHCKNEFSDALKIMLQNFLFLFLNNSVFFVNSTRGFECQKGTKAVRHYWCDQRLMMMKNLWVGMMMSVGMRSQKVAWQSWRLRRERRLSEQEIKVGPCRAHVRDRVGKTRVVARRDLRLGPNAGIRHRFGAKPPPLR